MYLLVFRRAIYNMSSLFIIYCRKSSEAEDRQVLSIESQTREMQQVATRLGLQVEVVSEAMSAKAPGRPAFNEMMQRLYRGEAAGIICWKLDRLARNPIDGGSIIWAIKQHGIKVITPSQTFSNSDDNTILMYIEFGMAQKYVDDLSRNVKRGLKTKAENGWQPGIAPVGYLNEVDCKTGEKRIAKDPARFSIVRQMWDLMLSGLHTPPRILRTANDEWGFRTRPTRKQGGRPLSRSALYQIFTNTFYFGSYEYPRGSGRILRGKHEPMVTEHEYDRVQTLLGREGNPRPRSKQEFSFTGVIRCGECNHMVTAEEKHHLVCDGCRFKFSYRNRSCCPRCGKSIEAMANAIVRHYTYYHCPNRRPICSQPWTSEADIVAQFDAFLTRIHLATPFKEWAVKYLQEIHQSRSTAKEEIRALRQKAYEDCLSRLEGLLKLRTSPENRAGQLITDEEYSVQRSELLVQKATLEDASRSSNSDAPLELAIAVFEFAATARERFARGDAKTRKAIMLAVGSNLSLKYKKLFVEAKKPFRFIEESRVGADARSDPIEPKNNDGLQGPNGPLRPIRPFLLGEMDEDRTLWKTYRKMVSPVYSFFKQRASCPCEDCQADWFDVERLARRRRPKRWNALSTPATNCILQGHHSPQN